MVAQFLPRIVWNKVDYFLLRLLTDFSAFWIISLEQRAPISIPGVSKKLIMTVHIAGNYLNLHSHK